MNRLSLIKLAVNQTTNMGKEYISYKFNKIMNKPSRLYLDITYRCNLKCKYCDTWKVQHPKSEISSEEKIKILGKIKNWLGPFPVTFSGGEPYLKPKEMHKLSNFCEENNIISSTNSNGYLIDRKLAREITKSGLNTLIISLDGIKPNTHNYIRGINDSYQKAFSALSYLNEYRDKMRLGINTVLTDYNMEEIMDLIKFARKLNSPISIQPLMPNFPVKLDFSCYKKSELWPKDIDRVGKIIDDIIEMKKDGFPIKNTYSELKTYKSYYQSPDNLKFKQCYSGVRNIIISPYGKWQLCYEMEPIGDINQKVLKNIWKSDKANEQRTRIKNCRKPCKILLCNRKHSFLRGVLTFLGIWDEY